MKGKKLKPSQIEGGIKTGIKVLLGIASIVVPIIIGKKNKKSEGSDTKS